MKKIIFAIATVCLALTAVSCERNLSTFTYDGKPCPYFSAKSINLQINAEDGGKVMVPVSRINTEGDAVVPFTFTDNSDGLFSCDQSTISFKDGEADAYIAVNHANLSEFAPFATYNFDVTLQGNEYIEVAASGVPSSTIKVQKEINVSKSDTPIGKTSIENPFKGTATDRDVYTDKEISTYYFVENVYGSGYDLEFYVDGEDVIVTSNEKPVYYYPNNGDVYIYDAVGEADGKNITIEAEYYLEAIGYSFGTIALEFTLP